MLTATMVETNSLLVNLKRQKQEESANMLLLQTEKLALLRKNEKLLEDIWCDNAECEVDDPADDKLFRQVQPLVSEIHKLELRKSEIHHQLHLLDIQREVAGIFSSLTTVTRSEERGILFPWFQQLKESMKTEVSGRQKHVCISQEPSYTFHRASNKVDETLNLRLNYSGISLSVSVSANTPLGNDSDTSLSTVRASCDNNLPDLQDQVRDLLKQNKTVEELLLVVKTILDTEVLPYI